jgi:hypothetical protein
VETDKDTRDVAIEAIKINNLKIPADSSPVETLQLTLSKQHWDQSRLDLFFSPDDVLKNVG